MERLFFVFGSLCALLSVFLGAFGAHALRGRLSQEMLEIFEVGVRYQMYHAFGLMAVSWAWGRWPGWCVALSGWLFLGGILTFSGSLYLLSLTGARWLGAIAPLGGTAFLLGWLLLAWGVYVDSPCGLK